MRRRTILLLAIGALALMLVGGAAFAATVNGTDGSDTLRGTQQDDKIRGFDGKDSISGEGGNDKIDGGNDADLVNGGAESDAINGGYGADDLRGGVDSDTIKDGPEDDISEDTIYGGDGNDDITSANVPNARDTINCGEGYDLVFADSLDTVSDDCEDTTTTLTPEEERAEGPPSPDYEDDVYTTQGIADTNCTARTDDPHPSKNATPPYSEALSVVGVRNCDYQKQRIWVDAILQRWVPYTSGGYWKTVRSIRDSDYDMKQNLKPLAYKCPTRTTYWYRAGLLNATIVDYDGDRHEMLFARWSNERHFKCQG